MPLLLLLELMLERKLPLIPQDEEDRQVGQLQSA